MDHKISCIFWNEAMWNSHIIPLAGISGSQELWFSWSIWNPATAERYCGDKIVWSIQNWGDKTVFSNNSGTIQWSPLCKWYLALYTLLLIMWQWQYQCEPFQQGHCSSGINPSLWWTDICACPRCSSRLVSWATWKKWGMRDSRKS